MVKTLRIVLMALSAALVLAVAAGVASASRLSLSSQTFRVVYEPVEFPEPEGTVARCNLTLEGSFHSRTFAKVRASQVGYITSARTSSCVNFGAEMLAASLPWPIRYASFGGRLPTISSVTLEFTGHDYLLYDLIPGNIFKCLYLYAVGGLGAFIVNLSSGVITGLRYDETRIHSISENDLSPIPICWEDLGMRGTGRVTVPGSSTTISIRLI
jgi:hypothetical protein